MFLFYSILSIVVDILFIIILAKILLGIARSVIPRQLLQLCNALFWHLDDGTFGPVINYYVIIPNALKERMQI